MRHIITKIDISFYFGIIPAKSTIVLYGLHGINILLCFCTVFFLYYILVFIVELMSK